MQDNEQAIKTPQVCLVSLTFKFGRQGGRGACDNQDAEDSVIKATKRTICKEAFAPLKKIVGEFRSTVASVTLPWDIKGISICKPSIVARIMEAQDTYGPQFEEAKLGHLLARYEEWKAMTKRNFGGAWNESKFPTKENLTASVFFRLIVMPLPESEMFGKVKGIDGELMAQLIELNDARIKAGIRRGMIAAYNRLMEPLQHMVDLLVGGGMVKIHESLVENVRVAVKEIPSLNLSDDPELLTFAEKAGEFIKELDAGKLRGKTDEAKAVRRNVAQDAVNILSTFGRQGVRKFNQ